MGSSIIFKIIHTNSSKEEIKMVCVNCGKKLIRGYAFCMECGSPVPPEVLEEGGMPGRTDNEGRPSKPETEGAPKKESEPEKPVSEVQSSMPGVEPLDGGNNTETLVFCPNCGMHMQGNSYQCNKCGMYLVDKPKNIPLSAGGVPLMNPDEMAVGGGSIGSFSTELDGVSDSEIDQISSFMSGSGVIPIFAAEDNSNPDLFGNGISANDFAALSEQLANFSAANEMPSIDAVEHEPKKNASKSNDRQVDNFSMSDDGTGTVTITENTVPVIGSYSMDEDPGENVNLDPYKFLNNSMDDAPSEIPEAETPNPAEPEFEPIFSKSPAPSEPVKQDPEPAPKPEPERIEFEPIFASSAPASKVEEKSAEQPPEPPSLTETPSPVQVEESPVITETSLVQDVPKTQENDIFSQPVPPRPAPVQEAPRGNMFRCQFCGQSVYDTDKFCSNCGASYKNGNASSRKKSKAPFIIIIAVLLIALAASGYFVLNSLSGENMLLSVFGIFENSTLTG